MAKVKSLNEAVEDYVMSSVISAIRYERVMRKKGWQDSVEKAARQGIGMIAKSGMDPKKAVECLAEVEVVAREFRTILEKRLHQSPTKHF